MIFQSSFYKSKNILLIEDVEPVRASIKGMLQQIGFENITAVADASQAVALAARKPFDFILADFELGEGKDALQLFDDLKQQALLKPGGCYAVISAEPRCLPLHGVLTGQPDCFLLKPFTYIELEKRLARALQSKLALRKVYLAWQQQRPQEAWLQLDEITKTSPAHTLLALRVKGEMLLAGNEHEAAFQLYSTICRQRRFGWARLGQAIALFRLQRDEETEQALLRLLQDEETRAEALNWIIRLYIRQQNHAQAIVYLTERLRLSASDTVHQHALALLYLCSGDPEAAGKHWQWLTQQYRFSAFDSAEPYLALARLQLEQCLSAEPGHFSRYLKKVGEVLGSIPQKVLSEQNEPELRLLHARVAIAAGDLTAAKDLATEFRVTDMEMSLPLAALADYYRLLSALGEQTQAEQVLDILRNMIVEDDLPGDCMKLQQQLLLQQNNALPQHIRELTRNGMADIEAGNAKAALQKLWQALLYMPVNPGLLLALLQLLCRLPPHQLLQPLSRTVQKLLEQTELPPAGQQRLPLLLEQLPELYRA